MTPINSSPFAKPPHDDHPPQGRFLETLIEGVQEEVVMYVFVFVAVVVVLMENVGAALEAVRRKVR